MSICPYIEDLIHWQVIEFFRLVISINLPQSYKISPHKQNYSPQTHPPKAPSTPIAPKTPQKSSSQPC